MHTQMHAQIHTAQARTSHRRITARTSGSKCWVPSTCTISTFEPSKARSV
jgi:hypothetical protein